MGNLEKIIWLNNYLLEQMPEYKKQSENFEKNESSQFKLFRSLSNVRASKPVSEEFLEIQKQVLQNEIANKGVVEFEKSPQIEIFKGDITTLKVDAIVNAGNSALLGCFYPCHGCIDNAIHTYSGVELRLECAEIMQKQGHDEKTGNVKMTNAYNLPSKYILHTVGPIVSGELTDKHRKDLENCYKSCLKLAIEQKFESIAFCCISTGEYMFDNEEAGKIAVNTVKEFLKESEIKVIFNVFKQLDFEIYERLLG